MILGEAARAEVVADVMNVAVAHRMPKTNPKYRRVITRPIAVKVSRRRSAVIG